MSTSDGDIAVVISLTRTNSIDENIAWNFPYLSATVMNEVEMWKQNTFNLVS